MLELMGVPAGRRVIQAGWLLRRVAGDGRHPAALAIDVHEGPPSMWHCLPLDRESGLGVQMWIGSVVLDSPTLAGNIERTCPKIFLHLPEDVGYFDQCDAIRRTQSDGNCTRGPSGILKSRLKRLGSSVRKLVLLPRKELPKASLLQSSSTIRA
jgi:hypothetical protein